MAYSHMYMYTPLYAQQTSRKAPPQNHHVQVCDMRPEGGVVFCVHARAESRQNVHNEP